MIAATVEDGRLVMHPLHRFANRPIQHAGGLHWDIVTLESEMQHGLGLGAAKAPEGAGLTLGIDSWALDYCRIHLDRADAPLAPPRHYRDFGIADGVAAVHRCISFDELYRETGTQFLPFNTIYQLAAERAEPIDPHERMLLIPDALVYRLTGSVGTEITNASCTGMFDVRTRQWHKGVIERLGIDASLLADPIEPGTVDGPTTTAFGGRHIEVVRVASHDTASAVLATPGDGDDWAFISSGTWSLVGVELQQPVITPAGLAANLSNELGVDGTVRCLRNVAGMWLLQESIRAWRRAGRHWRLGELLTAAADIRSGPTFDPDDPDLITPGDLPERIRARCGGLSDDIAVTRAIIDSLAVKYGEVLDRLESITGRRIRVVHIVGGGSRNALLCQLTADASGRIVVAGPVEATAMGNALIQARATGSVVGGLDELRDIVRRSTRLRTYEPRDGSR